MFIKYCINLNNCFKTRSIFVFSNLNEIIVKRSNLQEEIYFYMKYQAFITTSFS